MDDLTNVDARRAEFRCGHTPGPQDDFTPHEDGLTLHEAGHLLYRDGEYAAALTCMERAAERGNLWADRDTVVVRQDLFGAVRRSPVRAAERPRRVLVLVAAAAATVAAAASFSYARADQRPRTVSAPAAVPDEQPPQFSSVVLRPQPDSDATRLGLTAAPASIPATPPVKTAPKADGLLADRSVKFEAPNEKGDWSTAYVPRETRGRSGTQRQLHFNATPGGQLVTTLQSTREARCVWVFTGTDGSGSERSSAEFEVAPDSAKKVEVPVGASDSFTVTARSDARAGECLVVDPRFDAAGGAEEEARAEAARVEAARVEAAEVETAEVDAAEIETPEVSAPDSSVTDQQAAAPAASTTAD
ncbi:hypothetical protein [Actinoplanes subglobosus]|uniref:Uncharacterized protein n=1 Tax=Actinoplanes subglobosus TaxID=1547892 RepID=A0ABV8ITE2_9ACTN